MSYQFGGIFAPSLYIGTMIGGALGLIFQIISPSVIQQPFTYALAGMGALFAGAAQAPLNVIIMIPEMSGDYALLPPLMISSASSFFVAWIFLRGSSIYTIKLERRNIRLRMGRSFAYDTVKVEEVMTKNVDTIISSMPLPVLEILFEEYKHVGYPVIEKGKLVGMITLGDLTKIPSERREELKVGDVATKPLIVAHPDETVHKALDRLYERDIGRLPVVDREDPNRLIGIISRSDIIRAFEIGKERPVE